MGDRLSELIARQRRLITRAQALNTGLPAGAVDNLIRRGAWSRLLPEVYLVGPLPVDLEPLLELQVRASQLWTTGCAVGGRAAAWWAGWLPAVPATVELLIPHSRKLSVQPGFTLVRAGLDPLDTVRVRGVLITSAARTALDLAARADTDLLDTMLRKGWFDEAALAAALDRGRHRRGWSNARAALAGCATRPFSAAERMLHAGLLAAGITGWRANVHLQVGGRHLVPDLLFDAAKLIVEIDGHAHHSSRDAFERDRSRQNLLVAAGYRVLRFTWAQIVADIDGVIAQIVAELRRSAA